MIDRIDRLDKIERIYRICRIDRIARVDRVDRTDRTDRIDKIDRQTGRYRYRYFDFLNRKNIGCQNPLMKHAGVRYTWPLTRT